MAELALRVLLPMARMPLLVNEPALRLNVPADTVSVWPLLIVKVAEELNSPLMLLLFVTFIAPAPKVRPELTNVDVDTRVAPSRFTVPLVPAAKNEPKLVNVELRSKTSDAPPEVPTPEPCVTVTGLVTANVPP